VRAGQWSTGYYVLDTDIWECFGYSTTGEAQGEVTVLCPRPVNFRQTEGHPGPNGALHFEYRWDSNTGNLAHLACNVGERVTYSTWPFPNPPFADSPPNPAEINVPASDGVFSDIHSTLLTGLYSSASVGGAQIYRTD